MAVDDQPDVAGDPEGPPTTSVNGIHVPNELMLRIAKNCLLHSGLLANDSHTQLNRQSHATKLRIKKLKQCMFGYGNSPFQTEDTIHTFSAEDLRSLGLTEDEGRQASKMVTRLSEQPLEAGRTRRSDRFDCEKQEHRLTELRHLLSDDELSILSDRVNDQVELNGERVRVRYLISTLTTTYRSLQTDHPHIVVYSESVFRKMFKLLKSIRCRAKRSTETAVCRTCDQERRYESAIEIFAPEWASNFESTEQFRSFIDKWYCEEETRTMACLLNQCRICGNTAYFKSRIEFNSMTVEQRNQDIAFTKWAGERHGQQLLWNVEDMCCSMELFVQDLEEYMKTSKQGFHRATISKQRKFQKEFKSSVPGQDGNRPTITTLADDDTLIVHFDHSERISQSDTVELQSQYFNQRSFPLQGRCQHNHDIKSIYQSK